MTEEELDARIRRIVQDEVEKALQRVFFAAQREANSAERGEDIAAANVVQEVVIRSFDDFGRRFWGRVGKNIDWNEGN